MNATRAATIRLRSSFDGAVSLGRVQTPTLAIVARREEEIKAFVPEPYWLVDATFEAPPLDGDGGERVYVGHYQAPPGSPGDTKGRASAPRRRPRRSSPPCAGGTGTITKLEKKEQREKAPMLYDLTTLQREANTRFGFSAKRTLGRRAAPLRGAQGADLSAHQLALPDDRHGRGDQADRRARRRARRSTARGARVRDRPRRAAAGARRQRREGHRPPRDHPDALRAPGREDERRRPPHLRHGRAALPRGLPPRGGVREHARGDDRRRRGRQGHVFRTRGKLLLVPGWRGVYDEVAADARAAEAAARRTRAPTSSCRGWSPSEEVRDRDGRDAARKETKPPRRYSDASLLGAMETAGKLVDDDELREAMKDSGIGTPATRAAIIERLITVGYVERDGRALVATEKGLNVIRLLGEHALTSPGLTGSWEQRLGKIERGEDSRKQFMSDIAGFAERDGQDARRDAQGRAHPARAARAVPGLRPRDRREPQGLLVLVARRPRLRLRDLEGESRQAAAGRDRARADPTRLHRAAR